jgi:co-chaperonin GroES (HSP10)
MKMQPKKTQKGSIRLSDGAAEESDFAEIVAAGPDVYNFQIGDVVLRPTPADYEWTDEDDNGQLYLITKDCDIAAKVKNVS